MLARHSSVGFVILIPPIRAGKLVILDAAPDEMKLALKACSEKGASSWVTAVPTYDHGTVLHNGEFVDAVCIRYGPTVDM